MAQPLTTITGTIARVSEHGFQIREQPAKWLNISKFVDPQPVIPALGTEVDISVNGKGFVCGITPSSTETVQNGSPAPVEETVWSDTSAADTVTIRLGCLSAAAEFLSARDEAKSTDVLRVAEAWEGWIRR